MYNYIYTFQKCIYNMGPMFSDPRKLKNKLYISSCTRASCIIVKKLIYLSREYNFVQES